MNIRDYVNERRLMSKYLPNNDIVERWETRIVPASLQHQGELGVQSYLSRYGKSIGYPKCIMFARHAESYFYGVNDFALGFWKKAFSLEFPNDKLIGDLKDDAPITSQTLVMEFYDDSLDQPDEVYDFPAEYQPGKLVTMQPSDAQHPREYYIADDRYHGQPKRDGNKLIVFATPKKVWYQSRQLKVDEVAPSPQMDTAFREVAKHSASFIVEGELYFLDVAGKEHMTGATCLAANAKMDEAHIQPRIKFSAFGCLCIGGKSVNTKGEQVFIGDELMEALCKSNPSEFEILLIATTRETKQQLADQQKANGCEGEVWFRADLPHRPGKITSSKDPFFDGYVRTKYSIGIQRYRITKVAPSRAAGHTIGGFSIQDADGNDVGTVGTGYTREEQIKILELFTAQPENAWVLVDGQAMTVYNKIRHARFVGFVEE